MSNIEIINRDYSWEDIETVISSTRESKSSISNNRISGRRIIITAFASGLSLTPCVIPETSFAAPIELNIENYLKNYQEIEKNQREISSIINLAKTKSQIVREILSFKSLVENWDGYGAYPLEIGSATNALFFLDNIDKKIISEIYDVYPNPNGTVSFEWKSKLSEIALLEIGNETMSYYIEEANSPTIYKHKIAITKDSCDEIAVYISKFF